MGAALFALFAIGVFPSLALAAPPSATTEPATEISQGKATLNAEVDPGGLETSYQFEYGTDTTYGAKAPASPQTIGSGSEPVALEETVEELQPETLYHFRVVATNSEGTTYGEDQTFVTWGKWTLESPPTPEYKDESWLSDVSCVSPESCLAVGYDDYEDEGIAQDWNGQEWELRKGAAGAKPTSISCDPVGGNKCLAIGEKTNGDPYAERWSFFGSEFWIGPLETAAPLVPEGGTDLKLKAVSCSGGGWACTLVGSYKLEGQTRVLAERYDPQADSWSVQASATSAPGAALTDVSCPAAGECVAVGHKPKGESSVEALAERWDGSEWSALPAAAPQDSTASFSRKVSCPSSEACVATGLSFGGETESFTATWDGEGWNQAGAAPETFDDDLSCASSSSCIAVGKKSGETHIQAWSGAEWTSQPAPSPEGATASLAGVSCSSVSDCVAVGKAEAEGETVPLALRYGAEWTLESPPTPEYKDESWLSDVSCVSAESCLAVGYDEYEDEGIAQDWNGEGWELRKGAAGAKPTSVSCDPVGGTKCLAIGEKTNGDPYAERWFRFGSSWIGPLEAAAPLVPEGGTGLKLEAVSCSGEGWACTLVGSYKLEGQTRVLAERYDPQADSWSVQASATSAPGAQLSDVSCPAAGECVAVGHKPQGESSVEALAERWDGSEWSVLPASAPQDSTFSFARKVSCPSSEACVATGLSFGGETESFTATWDGEGWTQAGAAPEYFDDDLSCASSSSCIAVGKKSGETHIQAWSGAEWTSQPAPSPEGATASLAGVSCSSVSDCVAVGKAEAEGETVPLALRLDDETAPDTTITGGPEGLTSNPNATFSFEATEIASTFECALDEGEFTDCASPTSYEGLADGPHVFRVRATDSAGNLDQTPAEREFEVDSEAPETTISGGEFDRTAREQTAFYLEADEEEPTFECRRDAGAWEACSARKGYIELTEGAHQFEARATDEAGNTDATPAVRTWTVDPLATTRRPEVSGTPRVGQTLTVSEGTWGGTAPEGFDYQWYSCPSASPGELGSCEAISGATTSTYVLTSEDENRYLMAEVTGKRSEGSSKTPVVSRPTLPARLVAEPPPAGKEKIAYQGCLPEQGCGIIVSPTDSHDPTLVFKEELGFGIYEGLTISPDGNLLAFSGEASEEDTTICLHLMQAQAGATPVKVYCGEENPEPPPHEIHEPEHPEFTPDGSQLVFHRHRGGLVKVNLDGSGLTTLVEWDDPETGRFPKVSPDGKKLLFYSRVTPTGESNEGWWMTDSDGSNPQHICDVWGDVWSCIAVDFFPDSKTLLVIVMEEGAPTHLAELDVETGERTALVQASPVWDEARLSADGELIVYADENEEGTQKKLYVASVDGTVGPELLFPESDVEWASWPRLPLPPGPPLGGATEEEEPPEEENEEEPPGLLELLERYRPVLFYDSREKFFADSVRSTVDWHENKLWSGIEANVLADNDEADTTYPDLSESLLGERAADSVDDVLDEVGDSVEAASTMHLEPDIGHRVYGRVIRDPEIHTAWLQYWIYYYYNDPPAGTLGTNFGAHEGDWEFVQIGYDTDQQRPVYATYNQHDHSETCPWSGVSLTLTPSGRVAPAVFPAVNSHASYFNPGSYDLGLFAGIGQDEALGDVGGTDVAMTRLTQQPWFEWEGRWGGTFAGHDLESSSPSGPGHGANSTEAVDPIRLVDESVPCRQEETSSTPFTP